jgi:hypothetical protein
MAAKKLVDPDVKQLRRLFMFNKPDAERHALLKKLGRRLPAGLAPELAEAIFRKMFIDTYHDPNWAELITPEYARLVLNAYKKESFISWADMRNWLVAAVDENADDATLATQLREAWVALKRLHVPQYAETREGIDATLTNPRWIEATQAAIASTPNNWNWSRAMVGLLLADGSAGSIDVLIPMALEALKKKGQDLDKLRGLAERFGASTPEVESLRSRLKSETDDRAETGGANAFARAIGLPAKDNFQFQTQFFGERKNGARIFEVTLWVDAAKEQWGWMRLLWVGGRRWCQNEWTNKEEKCFSNNYPMRKLERLPGWLGDIAVARKCTFKLAPLSTNLEGEAAAKLKEWLKSATVPKKTGWATTRS